MRSLLFIPGNKDNMLAKASSCAPDVLVPDMEDSIPDGEKAAARALISDWIPRLGTHQARLMPRVNSIRTPWFKDDVAAVVRPGVWGISIGKIDSAADISLVSDVLAEAERNQSIEIGSMKLIPWIETAPAIVNCYEICKASDRITAVAFGGEDLTTDMGIERLDDESNLVFARSTICTAAKAANVLALDTPYFQFRDEQGLKASCIQSRQLGFKGRFAIHPAQIDVINTCFAPNNDEIELARRIVEAFEQAERNGRGSTSLDGRVIDVPVVKRARALLAQADATR
jgi:citrate lyase subunit beta/citryl-CoA lyase